jgi:hypothetical protein
MQVRRDLQPLNAPSNFSAAAKRRIVQHAELDLMVVTVSKIRHSERIFTMTEDAHPSVHHSSMTRCCWQRYGLKNLSSG